MKNKKMKQTKTQIKNEMVKFLDNSCGRPDRKPNKYSCGIKHKNCLVLATSRNDMPRATPLEFFNEGLTIYIIGEPGKKIANIRKNSNVSAAVYEQPLDHSKRQKSLQIFGTAELITMKDNARLIKAKLKKWNFLNSINILLKKRLKGKTVSEKERKAFQEKILNSLFLIKITTTSAVMRKFNTELNSEICKWEK
ncbi:pyridoxamine 5'-phosphate oxidase family protein [Spirochaetota bacterium]